LIEKEKVEFKTEEVRKEEVQKGDVQKEETLKILSEHLLQARRLLEQRDYEAALKENQKILSFSSQNPPGDEALFNMGLIYAHFGNPKKDYGKSVVFFRKLMKDYPQSPLVEQARIWTGILRENEKLSQTIQKLNQVIEDSKHVDIEIEEKKREKAK
jgi:tetratricopeptide (TPR) repeat protein